ncbi:MAG TPA: CHASE3 domain-containing protein [Jatrophihabitans sp.]|nr:CHASE3 domain-containing protein [Jatrophihabitans sp.]
MATPHGMRARGGYSLRAVVLWTVGALVALLVATTVVTSVVRMANRSALHTLQGRWLPAQVAAEALTTAYLNQETGARGYLLSGEARFLQPYRAGAARAAQLQPRLRALLSPDAAAASAVRAAATAGRRWRVAAAEPAISARAGGPISAARLNRYDSTGKALFDTLRARLAELRVRTAGLVAGELNAVKLRQTLANIVAAASLVLALLVAALAVPFLRRMIIRPLAALVGRLRTVADGDYEHAVALEQGPQELQTIADAAERMRDGVVTGSAALADAQSELALRDERDRLAADLHDHTIQRLFALGLTISSATSRNPELAPVLVPMIEESDGIIRELRGFIYGIKSAIPATGLSTALARIVTDSARALGFMPETTIGAEVDKAGAPDTAAAASAALREALSNVARHAHATRVTVSVGVDDEYVVMRVADNGVGFAAADAGPEPVAAGPRTGHGLGNIRSRAQRLGGTASISASPGGGTVVEWRVPLAAAATASR